jgi:four helix bundle protein
VVRSFGRSVVPERKPERTTGIERFEDLKGWQEARTLARVIYQPTERESFRSRGLAWQLQDAAGSCMGNIAEAHGRYSFEDKRRFLDVALGSCEELQSHLYIALDCAYIPQSGFDDAYRQADTPRRGIWADMPPATLRSRGRLPRLQEGRKRGALPAGPTERGGPHRRTPAVRRDVMALSNSPRGLCLFS